MILTIKNQTTDSLLYLGGLVTVSPSSNTVVSRDLNVILTQDATFIFDCTSERIIINNGATDLSGGSALELIKFLAGFALEEIATMPLYYSAPVSIDQSANTASGTTVWSMRNAALSPLQVIIEKIELTIVFDAATPLARQTLGYDLRRFSGATPTGGSPITVVKSSSLSAATTVTDVRSLDTGLTVSGVSFEGPLDIISVPAVSGASTPYLRNKMAFKLAAGEGFAIRLANQAVAGQGIYGKLTWSAR